MAANKTIYTIVGGKIFKINQDVTTPSCIYTGAKTNHASAQTDGNLKSLIASIYINTMETSCVKTNKELANAMLEKIKEEEITEIDTVSNNFKVYIDYSIHNKCCELGHSVVIKPLSPMDMVYPLGVATNNECVYRRVKTFKETAEFSINNPLPLGIMQNKQTEFYLKINDITIYQDISTLSGPSHNSIYCTPYGIKCTKTINPELSNYIPIYSTKAEGMVISDITAGFIPRKVSINLELSLASLIVFYDGTQVDDLLQENIDKKYKPDIDPTPGPDDPDEGHLIPDPSRYPDADGSQTPDANGWYDYYEKCLSTNPKALLVVEDNMSDAIFDPVSMIRKRKVLLDIPDVQIGDFVRYVIAHKEQTQDPDSSTDTNYPSEDIDNQGNNSGNSGTTEPTTNPDTAGYDTGTITTDYGNTQEVTIISIDDI